MLSPLLLHPLLHQEHLHQANKNSSPGRSELCHPQPSTVPPHSRPLPLQLQEFHVEMRRGTGTQTCIAVTTLRASPCNLPQQGEVCSQLEPRELKSKPAWDVDEAKALGCILKTHPKSPHITYFPTVLFKQLERFPLNYKSWIQTGPVFPIFHHCLCSQSRGGCIDSARQGVSLGCFPRCCAAE